MNLAWGRRSSGHCWYLGGKISFRTLFKSLSHWRAWSTIFFSTVRICFISLYQDMSKNQKSPQGPKRENTSITLNGFFPEMHKNEPWKPQYSDGRDLTRDIKSNSPSSQRRAWGLGAGTWSTSVDVLLEAALGLEPRTPTSFHLCAQPELGVIPSVLSCSARSAQTDKSCLWASALLYRFSPVFLTRPSPRMYSTPL